MRILFANDGVRDAGGVQSYLDAVMHGLVERGHQLGLIHTDQQTDRLKLSSLSKIPHFSITTSGIDRAFEEIGSWSPDACFSHNMYRLDVERRLLDTYPVVKFMHGYIGTCIGGQKTFFLPTAEPCARVFGKPCLALYFPRRCGGRSLNRMFDEYAWAKKQSQLFPDYAAVIVASQHMKDEFARNGVVEEKIHVNPLFPTFSESGKEKPDAKDKHLQVLFMGRMTKLKGGDLLIRAVAEASQRIGQNIRLVMAGDGNRRDSWKALASKLHVQAEFPGWVTGEEHERLLIATSLLAVPSVWPEPFGLVGLEAACYGVPAIAFDVGGIREWLRDGINGYLVESNPPTVNAFADALVNALGTSDKLEAMRSAAQETARAMSLRKHLDAVETVLVGANGQNLCERSGKVVPGV